ncbi:LETM1-related biofilm-associated protein [Aquimarina sp. 2201CG5-10]|uniref:LETM1-related biofilm-associated protein n=1 Tax=Aquimarina callyspongiae TaxID=3098150 RepID=UPI002AB379EC|nr:LETM1-related biofilm-associated protein [Aquimarina sp. 2201CG5-10]MDY8137376.1 LETM1-related biofilm-associated protein [Aquimarina sp. 2201CG5-10]
MNPSTSGWIDKFLRDLDNDPHLMELSLDHLYTDLKKAGFIYGTSIHTIFHKDSDLEYSEEERTKINLFTALVVTYYDTIENAHKEDCIEALTHFYNFLDTKKSIFSFINALATSKSEKLEKIIHTRIQTNESIFKKNFSHLLTNALLFIDVLAFEHYLIHDKNPIEYASKLEETLTNTVFLALNSKQQKDDHDELLVKLFASSVRYTEVSAEEEPCFDQIELGYYTDELVKRYILDLTCLAVWNDEELDKSEHAFISALGAELNLEQSLVTKSVKAVHSFIKEHKEDISFFNYSHPALHFYKQTSRTVSVLVLRNKKRLIKEISESKDLMVLLGQSTVRDLSKEEKQQVKKQLLDICKTIPSLAIFILPGGSLLLPLLVKFIPQLLPSAFNENK